MPISAVLNVIVPIALGALIGYFTNELAIRMLFRPRRPVFIGKWQLPFTPGIIPKNQGRIAGAVAAAVSGQLFTPEDLVTQLKGSAAKEEIARKLADAVFSPELTIRSLSAVVPTAGSTAGPTAVAAADTALPEPGDPSGLPGNPEEEGTSAPAAADTPLPAPAADDAVINDTVINDTVINDAIVYDEEASGEEEPDPGSGQVKHTGTAEKVGAFVADRVAEKLAGADLHDAIEDLVWEGVQEYRKNPVIALFLNETVVDALCAKVESALRSYVNGDGRRVIGSLVTEEARKLADMPLCELADRAGLKRERVADVLSATLDRFVEQFGASFSEKADIGGIVRRKIESMDAAQLEDLVMSVMKRELRAVINLGALLGAIIGAINILI